MTDGKKNGKFSFENEDIAFNVVIKMLSWSYIAVKKYHKESLESELTKFIIKALSK